MSAQLKQQDDPALLFKAKVDRIIADIYANEQRAVDSAYRFLTKLRAGIVKDLDSENEIDRFRARELMRSINHRLADFELDLVGAVDSAIDKSFDLGTKLVDEPIRATGVGQIITGISREPVQVASVFSADLIRNLTDDVRAEISEIVAKAASGLSTQDAIALVGESLTSKGVFKSVTARAEAIVRTEVLRIQSISTQARMQSQAQTMQAAGYTLKKVWLATLDNRTRATHLQAQIEYGANGSIGPIPVEGMFMVGGELAMYPRDPSLSAEESVMCRCVSQPIVRTVRTKKHGRRNDLFWRCYQGP